jgi:RNA polymerase sigma-70 factor (ECF subfamily)
MEQTPLSLLQRLQGTPSTDDWSRFVRLCAPLLYGWSRRNGLQESDAADLVQDVFAVLLVKLKTFRRQGMGSFRAWLHTVTLNKLRERARKRQVSLVSADTIDDIAIADDNDAVWDEEYRKQVVGQAMQLIRCEFEESTWQACWEHAVGGRNAADVGVELGLTPGAVRAAKFRVLNRLRLELKDILD